MEPITLSSVFKTEFESPQRKRPIIGVLVEETQGYWFRILAGMLAYAQTNDISLMVFAGGVLCDPREGFQAQRNIIYDLISAEHVDGLVMTSSLGNYVAPEQLKEFFQRYAALPKASSGREVAGVPSVIVENKQAFHDALVHLIVEHGFRRIAFVKGPENNQAAISRYQSYLDTLAQHGIVYDPALIAPGSYSQLSGEEAVRLLLNERKLRPAHDVQAIVAANDYMAWGVLDELRARGVRVPEEIAVVGFDDQPASRFKFPPLTTVQSPNTDVACRAIEILLQQLRGESVPPVTILPTTLVIRQSCGCPSQNILQAKGEPQAIVITQTAFQPLQSLSEKQTDHVCAAVTAVVSKLPGETADACLCRVRHVIEAFLRELHNPATDLFIPALKEICIQVILADGEILEWQTGLSVLRRQLLPYVNGTERFAYAEDLWQQARVLITEMKQQAEMIRRTRDEQWTQALLRLSRTLLTTFDMEQLMHVLATGLPHLGISKGYVLMYENPQLYAYPQAAPEWGRLVLAYTAEGMAVLPNGGERVPIRQFVAERTNTWHHDANLIMEPLYFRDHQLGLMVLEMKAVNEGRVYETLLREVSNALEGTLLVQRVQKNAYELSVANEEIRSLNDELKVENVRLGAELHVVRRLQQMILPTPTELQQVEGLEIVGYMQPADEVGGDYYDVLHDNGLLHIGIGDVTGHGLESGVLMLMTQASIRTLIEHGEHDPVKFVNTLNRLIYKNAQRMGTGKNLTFALVQYQGGQFNLVGQHEDVLVVRQGGQIERIDTTDLGFHVGLVDDISAWVKRATIVLQPGESMVLYTDGITEAINSNKQLYGIERLCEVLRQHWERSVEEIKQAVIDDLLRHIGTQKIFDDVTLIVIKQKDWK